MAVGPHAAPVAISAANTPQWERRPYQTTMEQICIIWRFHSAVTLKSLTQENGHCLLHLYASVYGMKGR